VQQASGGEQRRRHQRSLAHLLQGVWGRGLGFRSSVGSGCLESFEVVWSLEFGVWGLRIRA
jgi:hypothetical protein